MQKGNRPRVMSLSFRSLWSALFTCLIGVFKFCSRVSLLQKGFEHMDQGFALFVGFFFFYKVSLLMIYTAV